MVLIVGLGNPGRQYKSTRHNLGFRVVDEFRKENNFPKFKMQKKLESQISERRISGKKVILAKPQTFMNQSGQAVKKIVSGFKLQVSGLWVVHDDIDLPLGAIKIVKGCGAAGHKGVQSIIESLGTKDFVRVRIGIAPTPSLESFRVRGLAKFVLQKFTKTENKVIKESIKKAVQAVKLAILKGPATINPVEEI